VTTSVSGVGGNAEEKLRRKLAFFFMDPVRKFIAKRQVRLVDHEEEIASMGRYGRGLWRDPHFLNCSISAQ
jgi:hypothetical protein